MVLYNEKELGQAIKNGETYIEIEGDLGKKVIRIKAIGPIAWGICFSALAVAIVSVIATVGTGGVAAPVAMANAIAVVPIASATLGLPAAIAAIGIAVAGGSAGILNKLRGYKLTKNGNKVILSK
jgi:hypothetical protein